MSSVAAYKRILRKSHAEKVAGFPSSGAPTRILREKKILFCNFGPYGFQLSAVMSKTTDQHVLCSLDHRILLPLHRLQAGQISSQSIASQHSPPKTRIQPRSSPFLQVRKCTKFKLSVDSSIALRGQAAYILVRTCGCRGSWDCMPVAGR